MEKPLNILSYLKSKLAFRLWATMMILVLFSIGFLWIVQIHFFEPNYVQTSTTELENRIQSVIQDIAKDEIVGRHNPLAFLSRSSSGKVFLVDKNGDVLFIYGSGMPVEVDNSEDGKNRSYITNNYEQVIRGETTHYIEENGKPDMAIVIGVPVVYENESAALFVYNPLPEIQTMQEINRRQLFILCIVMTLVVSILAFFLTRQFTKPIYTIKSTVNRLAKGELTATPRLNRNDELGQLSDSVEKLGKALQKVDVLRKEVIANVSHELRSPISLIAGYSEMLRDITWSDVDRRKNDLNLIISESNRLSQMVDDIMDYSQLQAGYGNLNKISCNLYEIIEQETELESQIALEFQIQILLNSFSNEIPAEVDALKISQVLRNLLNNAINHTADGETILVTVTQNPESIKVSVSNPGVPISESDRKLIWERYRRVQHQGGRKQGTGIGLAIVSTILSAHGMQYGVDHTDGMNIFWFSLEK